MFTQLQGAVQVAAASQADTSGRAGEGEASALAGEGGASPLAQEEELGEVAFASLRSAYGVA